MSKKENQKLKLLYLKDYLLKYSNADHPVTVQDIIYELSKYDIPVERRTVYTDIQLLEQYGMDIITIKEGNSNGYYVASREFEIPELKLLVDSIQSSKFITSKKTVSLIKKIENLASIYDVREFNRQIYVANRIKAMNESIYYNIDKLHNAISSDSQVRFHYIGYNVYKEKVLRKDGKFYKMSPYALTYDNENYYLIAFDAAAGIIKHFRVDKMADISVLNEHRIGQEAFFSLDLGTYSKKVFGMFAGTPQIVKIKFDSSLADVVMDRFGHDVFMVPDDAGHFTVSTELVVSSQFFAWICGFGKNAEIISPAGVVSEMKKYIEDIVSVYNRY